jgi:acetylornithine deacetylase/succinyl-diaminopimelate desuccinylase family protein
MRTLEAPRALGRIASRVPAMIETRGEYIDDVLQRLVRIDSVNPSLDPDHPGETEISGYVSDVLESLGLDVAVHETEPGRPSVAARLTGKGSGRSLMLNAHYDTVGVEGMAQPFAGDIREGRLYGRGAYDMKGSLAACIGAVEAIVREGVTPAGDIIIAAVADEEHSSIGTMDIAARYPVDGAIVTEPTSLRVCLAHKGFTWLEVVTKGRAAHGSKPDKGIDANIRMGRILARLENLAESIAAGAKHPLLGAASLHAATLAGGSGLSTYAAQCTLGIERRTLPGETEDGVVAQIEEIVDELRAADPAFSAMVRRLLHRPAFEADPDSPLVALLSAEVKAVMGSDPEFIGDSPWMDSALLAQAGADTVVFGPHGEGAHADVEWVDLESVHHAADILARTALAYCG